jgi:hypothetical protein
MTQATGNGLDDGGDATVSEGERGNEDVGVEEGASVEADV